VASGDRLSAISRRFNRPVPDLIEANKLANPSLIVPGQELTIPNCLKP
jgi:LysM repeat protein